MQCNSHSLMNFITNHCCNCCHSNPHIFMLMFILILLSSFLSFNYNTSQFNECEWMATTTTYLDLQIVSIGEPGRCMLYWISCLSTMKISFLGVPCWYSVRQYCATPASTGKAFLFLQNLLTTHLLQTAK